MKFKIKLEIMAFVMILSVCSVFAQDSQALHITTSVCDDANSVAMTGPWWGWDPNSGPVAADNGDGTWTFTFDPAPTDNLEYLLVVDGVQEDLVAAGAASDDWSCTPITDYLSYANRQWTAGSGDVSNVYGTCSSECPTPAEVVGCLDANADNYNAEATVQGFDQWGNIACNYSSCDDIPDAEGCMYAENYSAFHADFTAANCEQYGGTACVEVVVDLGPTEQVLNLPLGWSMFSTYMTNDAMAIDVMLAPIVEYIVIAKNYLGSAYLPEWGFNGIGDVLTGQAYQIKTTEALDLTVSGDYMLPEENPIDLVAGWNMIGYLRLDGAPADLVLGDLVANDNVVIAKDYNGNAYLPEWNFNGIGNLEPGMGYQIKTNTPGILNFSSNDESYRLSEMEIVVNNVAHFSKVAPTDNNMTVVIEDAAWDVLPTEGSEVAAFDKAGNLIGSAIYSSPVTVLTVWGDDATTSSKDGLELAEVGSFKVWTSGTVRDFTVAEWSEGSASYNVDAINVASIIESNIELADLNSSDRVLVKVINVLGQEVYLGDDTFKGTVLFKVYDDGSVEKFVN